MVINNKGHTYLRVTHYVNILTYREFQEKHRIYNKTNRGSFFIEFKFNEKHWAIDTTEKSNCVGRLINLSKRFANVKPVVGQKMEHPLFFLKAICDINQDDEILYDYSDNSKLAQLAFPWLKT